MIDYKATGDLIGSMVSVQDFNVLVVLVSRGSDYIVSRYRNGEREWFSGTYFKDNALALSEFHKQCQKHCVS